MLKGHLDIFHTYPTLIPLYPYKYNAMDNHWGEDKDNDDNDDDREKINKLTAREQNGAAGLCPC